MRVRFKGGTPDGVRRAGSAGTVMPSILSMRAVKSETEVALPMFRCSFVSGTAKEFANASTPLVVGESGRSRPLRCLLLPFLPGAPLPPPSCGAAATPLPAPAPLNADDAPGALSHASALSKGRSPAPMADAKLVRLPPSSPEKSKPASDRLPSTDAKWSSSTKSLPFDSACSEPCDALWDPNGKLAIVVLPASSVSIMSCSNSAVAL